jgi:hypothetical protein
MLRTIIVALVLPGLLSAVASAQQPSASAPALGLGDNYTALARGYAAVAWNPAMLGLPDNPRTSLALLPARTIAGLDPVTLGDVSDYDGEFLPAVVREEWLRRVEQEGSEQGTGGGDITWIAAQAGRIAVQLGTSFRAIGNLTPGGAELLLFGNYGRAGTPRALDLRDSHVSAFAVSTAAVSYGAAIASDMTVGATLKFALGHLLLHGEDRGTAFTADPEATIHFPIVGSDGEGFNGNGGWGIGLDLGFATVRGGWTFGATLHNAFNTFAWNRDDLVFRAGLGGFDVQTVETDFDEQEFAFAPAHLKDFVEDARFPPMIAVGLSRIVSHRLTVTGDFRRRLRDSSIEIAPPTHLGIGAEYLVVPRVPLRGGVAYVDGGYQMAGGVGADFGPLSIAVSLMRRDTDLGVDTITMFTLISTMSR